MLQRAAAVVIAVSCSFLPALGADALPRPKAGKPQIFKEADIRPGMKAVAWTVFSGTQPEAVPIEIIGIEKNLWGPHQDIILGKMGGDAQRTNVAGGMSGSPVYIDGKLAGAVSLRLSIFSPDAVCGITPIEYMLEVNEYDQSRPADAKVPVSKAGPANAPKEQAKAAALPGLLGDLVAAGGGTSAFPMTPIATPLSFSGFTDKALQAFSPI